MKDNKYADIGVVKTVEAKELNSNTTCVKYFPEIDVIRCLGMFLVVLGHSFPDASNNGGIQIPFWRFVFNYIYSFHMPLFFTIAGFVSYRFLTTSEDKNQHIMKRMMRLLLPYLVWALIYIPFKLILVKYTSATFEWKNLWKIIIGNNPYSGLWFLYALFIIDLLRTLLIDNEKKERVYFVASFILLLTAKHSTIEEPIRWIFAYSFYYSLGYEIRRRYLDIEKICKNVVVIIFPAFIIFALTYFVDFENPFHGVSSIVSSISGIIMMFGIGLKLRNRNILREIGKYSMDIYILSGVFLVILRITLYTKMHMGYDLYVVVATAISFFLPIFVSKQIIRRNRFLSLVLLGDTSGISK